MNRAISVHKQKQESRKKNKEELLSNHKSVNSKFRALKKLQKQGRREVEELRILCDQRMQEATKLYVLGLKKFVARKNKGLEAKEEEVDTLREMLMGHHENRLETIRLSKSVLERIQHTERLVARYQTKCFTEVARENQYELDLVAIKILIRKNKRIYSQLPEKKKIKYDLGLKGQAAEMFETKDQKLARLKKSKAG